ncbi:MAG: hypothetical protein KJO21_13155 [Verrucomicrobiae bacterium]|nr:hypothetical protein [Verrucomicrobiae bacterium]NNJ44267.1 hypothetical protein [Akkermansiaceae bacterium]
MKTIRLLSAAFFLSLLSSCGLIQSVLKIPVGVLKTVGRTVGVSQLTHDAPEPVVSEAEDDEVAAEE